MSTILRDYWFFSVVAYLILNIPLAVLLGRMIKIGQQGDKSGSDQFAVPAPRTSLDTVPREAGSPDRPADLKSDPPSSIPAAQSPDPRMAGILRSGDATCPAVAGVGRLGRDR